MVGKPNQKPPVAPLKPIPMVEEPVLVVVGCMYVRNNWNRTHMICTSARSMSVTVNLLDLAYRQ